MRRAASITTETTEIRTISGWSVVWVFLILSICIVVVGYVGFETYKNKIKEDIHKQLLAITKIKTEQIVIWRNERLRDGIYTYKNPFIAMHMETYLDNGASKTEKNILYEQLISLREDQFFTRVILADRNGAVLLSTEEDRPVAGISIDTAIEPVFKRAMASNDIAISDLYLDMYNTVRLTVVVPISKRHHVKGGIVGDVIGAVLLDTNPYAGLFSSIQTWPIESSTAETLLIRRDGNEVLYLNELRHKKGTALMFRLPIDVSKQLPAAMAAMGQQGVVEGYDYRGHSVLAAIMPVPDTMWFIVSKIDRDEVYKPVVTSSKVFGVITVLLWALSGIGIGFIWQKRNISVIQRQYDSEERFRMVFDNAAIGIALSDKDYRFIDVNNKLCQMLEYTTDELRGMALKDISHPDDLNQGMELVDKRTELLNKLFNSRIPSLRIEKRYISKTGKILWVSSIVSIIRYAKGQLCVVTVIEDITLRKEMEAKLLRSNRLYDVLSRVNQSIVRIKDYAVLFKEICRICVEYGGFTTAWIGLRERETLSVKPAAFAGITEEELNGIVSCIVNRPNGTCPIVAVIRDDKAFICNNMATDHAVAICRNEALNRGYLSLGSFPIRKRGVAIGMLSLGVSQKDFFLDQEVKLMEEVVSNVSFALEAMEDELARKIFEQTTEKELKRNKMILDVSMDGYMLIDQTGNIREVNRAFSDLLGYSIDELCSMSVPDIDIGQTNAEIFELIKQIVREGHKKFETVLRHKDNRSVYVEVSVNCIELDGKIMLFSFHNDVTDKKHRDKMFLLSHRKAQMGEMLNIIAHQWKQPISAISSSVNKLKVELMFGTIDERVLKASIEKIDLLVQHMSQTIIDFSAFFRPKQDKDVSDIKSIIQKALDITGEQYNAKGIEICLICQSDTRIEIYANELIQVFLSILENAREAFEGRMVSAPMISISIHEDDTNVVVEIADNAGGISPGIMDNIFLPYYTTKEEFNGTGLGLYMANMIIEEHCHGKLVVRNIEDGASFTVELPKYEKAQSRSVRRQEA
ncbi:MAG: PAS domain S-box protein [Nitrospirae bacterium]|nr:PAS domain S-box protein [Nitrospirota bacterium]